MVPLWRGAAAAAAAAGLAVGLWTAFTPPPRTARGPAADAGPVDRGPAARERAPQPGGVRLPPGGGGVRPGPAPTIGISPPRPATPPAGVVAVIFDDAGATLEQLEPILALGRPVTVAVLPGLPASAAVAERALAGRLEVILHLPLEAEEAGRALGPGAVTTAMSDEAIAAQVRAGLDALPGVSGLSGHMGSRATADRRVMAAVLEVVRERGLFFVDSRTTARSVAAALAREMGIPTAERTVFLDNEDDPDAIAAQIRRLLELARTRGSAVGIGHAQKPTAHVLGAMLAEFDRARIVFVPVSSVVR